MRVGLCQVDGTSQELDLVALESYLLILLGGSRRLWSFAGVTSNGLACLVI